MKPIRSLAFVALAWLAVSARGAENVPLSIFRSDDGQIRLSWLTGYDLAYTVEWTHDVSGGVWTPDLPPWATMAVSNRVSVAAPVGGGRRFFRMVASPIHEEPSSFDPAWYDGGDYYLRAGTEGVEEVHVLRKTGSVQLIRASGPVGPDYETASGYQLRRNEDVPGAFKLLSREENMLAVTESILREMNEALGAGSVIPVYAFSENGLPVLSYGNIVVEPARSLNLEGISALLEDLPISKIWPNVERAGSFFAAPTPGTDMFALSREIFALEAIAQSHPQLREHDSRPIFPPWPPVWELPQYRYILNFTIEDGILISPGEPSLSTP